MENVSDALIMAGSVLVFIIALSVCISSFTTLRANIDNIVSHTETVNMAEGEEGYINYIKGKNAIRTVGSETVVSSVCRAMKENYIVYIIFKSSVNVPNSVMSTIYNTNGTTPIVGIRIPNDKNYNLDINKILSDGLYKTIRDKRFDEYLGEYQEKTEEGVSEANKITYRIITYVEKIP